MSYEGASGIKSSAELRLDEVVKGGARPKAETGRGCQAATLFLNYFSTDKSIDNKNIGYERLNFTSLVFSRFFIIIQPVQVTRILRIQQQIKIKQTYL